MPLAGSHCARQCDRRSSFLENIAVRERGRQMIVEHAGFQDERPVPEGRQVKAGAWHHPLHRERYQTGAFNLN